MRMRFLNVLGVLLLTSAQSSFADGFFDPHIRAGVSIGQMTLTDSGVDGHDMAWNVIVGFEVNRFIAIEGGYLTRNKPNEDWEVLVALPDVYDYYSYEVPNKGWTASAIGTWPINETVSVYGRGGLLGWDASERLFVNGALVAQNASDDGVDPFYGVGVGINVDNGLVRLEYSRSKILDFDATYISLAAVWRFGF